MLQQHRFAFTDITGMKSYDGPTFLKVLLEEIDPTASVNMELHRQATERAKNQGHNAVIKIIDSGLNKDGMLEYTIEFTTVSREKAPREYFSQPDNPDVTSLPTAFPKFQEAAKQLSDQDVVSILKPRLLNPAE